MSNLLNERKVYKTKDYSIFKQLRGNRKVDNVRVNQLMKLIEKNGNRTDVMPIIINHDGFVLDGQHRLEAVKNLGLEIGYVIENGDIDLVRTINQGGRNWSWYDVATSYADRGNVNYQQFIRLVDAYKFGFATNLRIISQVGGDVKGKLHRAFHAGELEAISYADMIERADRVRDILNLCQPKQTMFQLAVARITMNPQYDHERMVRKLKQLAHTLPDMAKEVEYMRQLESIYNQGYVEENRTRLF